MFLRCRTADRHERARSFALRSLACALLVATSLAPPASARRAADPNTLRAVALLQPAPDFAFDLGNGLQHLHDLAGRPVVISFWATWCRPCLDELPTFVRLRQTFGDRIALITVSSEAHDVAHGYLLSQNIALPVVEDPEKHIFAAYSVDPIPVTLVLDGSGRTRHISVGEIGWEELSTAVAAAMSPEMK